MSWTHRIIITLFVDRKVWENKVWDRNNFLGFFELGS